MAEITPPAPAPAPEIDEPNNTTTADMAVDNAEPAQVESALNGESNQKRTREDNDEDGVSKKQKKEEEEKVASGPVKLGFKTFATSVEMFDYFYNLLHAWPLNLKFNKYEHAMLLELLKNGHTEPDTKIGGGIRAFQVRKHPMWKSKCFSLVREDLSDDDFSFRKCVDHILPLPEEMQLKPGVDRALGGKGGGGRGGGGGGGGGRGRGKRGKSRH
ncbi:hypothetical protein RJT34_33420 [Clitoria ternatea]|uniref:Uncharacterized protein n=1 Tax=Clitoria ternatea TaxID=43366 RepID=A0AAN9EY58_CLITE